MSGCPGRALEGAGPLRAATSISITPWVLTAPFDAELMSASVTAERSAHIICGGSMIFEISVRPTETLMQRDQSAPVTDHGPVLCLRCPEEYSTGRDRMWCYCAVTKAAEAVHLLACETMQVAGSLSSGEQGVDGCSEFEVELGMSS